MVFKMSDDFIDKLILLCDEKLLHEATIDNVSNVYTIKCKEKHKDAKLKEINITDLQKVVAIIYDKVGLHHKLFPVGHQSFKACDAIIFCQFEDENYILIFDMKSSTPTDSDHIIQLKSGLIFSEYLKSLMNIGEGINVSNWNYRYFIFHCGSNKRETLAERMFEPPLNTIPDKPCILQVENGDIISIRRMLGKPLLNSQ